LSSIEDKYVLCISTCKIRGYADSQSGFSLLEFLIVAALISLVMVVAIPNYSEYRDRADNATADADISTISHRIELFYLEHQHHPDSLNEIGVDTLLDPWKNPYHYTRIEGKQGFNGLRKDKNLVPLNTDYDLYSSGKDGSSVDPITTGVSQDDIISANNGLFVGLASDY